MVLTGKTKKFLQEAPLWTALGLLLAAYKYLEFASNSEHVRFLVPLIEELSGAWAAGLLFPLVARVARRYRLDGPFWAKNLLPHLASLVLFGFTHTTLMWVSRLVAFPLFGLGHYDYGIMRVRYFMEGAMQIITYTLMVSGVYFFDRNKRASELEAKLSEARLQSLRLQLQPHFLFNALNTISELMYEDPRRADRMLASLSELLRTTLAEVPSHQTTLDQEIKTLELYLNLMRMRMEDKLSVQLSLAPESERALVPQLLLQPLVENAIRHGRDPQTACVSIRLEAAVHDGMLHLEVQDSGPGLKHPPPRKGIGLSNTAARLKQLYGARHEFAFANRAAGGFQVHLAIPYRT